MEEAVNHARAPSARSLCLGLLVCAAVAACGSGQQITEVVVPNPTERTKAIILMPLALAQEEATGYDIASRTTDISRWLLTKTALPVLGPADFSLLRGVDEAMSPASDTDLFAHAVELRTPVREAVVLHVLVTENRSTSVRDIQDQRGGDAAKQKTYRQHNLESLLRIQVTLFDSLRGRKLAGLVLETTDDPTAFDVGGDPRPGMTAAIRRALEHLLESAGPLLTDGGTRQTTGDGLVDSVPALLAWTAPGKKSWNEVQAAKDELTREAASLAIWDRFAPKLGPRDLAVAGRNRGVLVRQAQGTLLGGDVLQKIDGLPVVAAYQVDRALQACGAPGCKATVLRGGQPVEIQLIGPLRPAPVTSTP